MLLLRLFFIISLNSPLLGRLWLCSLHPSLCGCWLPFSLKMHDNGALEIFHFQLNCRLTGNHSTTPTNILHGFQIEETDVAGRRRALVTLGPNKHVGVGSSSRSSCSRSPPMFAEDQDGEGDEEARGLLSGSGSRPMMSSRGAVCAEGGVPGVGSRRKAAVGAGRAKRRTSLGARAGSSRPALPPAEGRGSSACTCAGGGGDGDDIEAGSSSCLSKKRPPKVSRRLFIDIENKASEPPPPRRHAPADRGRPAGRRQRGRAAAVRGLGLGPGARARRLGGGARGDADDDQGDSGGEISGTAGLGEGGGGWRFRCSLR